MYKEASNKKYYKTDHKKLELWLKIQYYWNEEVAKNPQRAGGPSAGARRRGAECPTFLIANKAGMKAKFERTIVVYLSFIKYVLLIY